MQQFDHEHAGLLVSVMSTALAAGRWRTDRWTEGKITSVQRAMAIPVDDAEQLSMRTAMVGVLASDLMMYAQGALLDGSLVDPSTLEIRLLSPNRPKGFDDLALDSVVAHDFAAQPSSLALAA